MARLGALNPNWKGGKVKVLCKQCACVFYRHKSIAKTAVFCSHKCKSTFAGNKRWSGHQRKLKIIRRPVKTIFSGAYSRLGIAKVCGHLTKKGRSKCAACSSFGKRVIKKCVVCGKEMSLRISESSKYTHCSKSCYGKTISSRQKGSASHLWKGGLTEEQLRLRGTAEYAQWRTAVFRKDGFRCVKCGIYGGELTADHIKPWSMFPALRLDISNGRTMCWPCHRKHGINPGSMNKQRRQALIEALNAR